MTPFDITISRKHSDCLKWDYMNKFLGVDTKGCLPSWVADSDFSSPDFLVDALHKRIDHHNFGYTTCGVNYFNATIDWFNKHHNVELHQNDFFITPGTLIAIAMILEETTNINDKILLFTPSYSCFLRTITNLKRQACEIPLINNLGHYEIDFVLFEMALAQGIKAMVFCNPHNPVGRCWSKDEIKKVMELCHQYGVYLISDEIWADYALFKNKYTSCLTMGDILLEKTAVCLSAAKTFNIPTFKLANTIIQDKKLATIIGTKLLAYGIDVYSALSLVATTVGYQQGAPWLQQIKSYIEKNIQFTHDFIQSEIPMLKYTKGEATYLAWIDCRQLKLNDKQLQNRFYNGAKVVPSMGREFGQAGSGYVRLNLSCPKSTLEKKLDRIKKEFN